MNEDNKNIYISYWLLLITLLVAFMIFVGGITRLTDSGLSITKWDLFSGVLPPIALEKWEIAFSLYKQIPEYILLNSNMTLVEFKFIYFWEYIHRLLGRIIGLFYILPLIYFTYKKFINTKKDIVYFYFIFILICFQGLIGWYMVKSGLSNRIDISHYRLSLHLSSAFFIYILLFIKYLDYKTPNFFVIGHKLPYNLPFLLLFLIFFQISFGALVSGLDAGKIYQSWPLMHSSYFPNDSNFSDLFSMQFFETPSLVQFVHRNIAYFIFIIFLLTFYLINKNNNFFYMRKISILIFIILLFQIILGIITVLSGAQIAFASMHQLGSIILISASLNLFFINSKVKLF